jgi:pyridoxine kinase
MQKRAAVINDFASFGRCSLAVSIPILSAMKVQCCPVPTAIFTNHTGFPSFQWTDYTAHMDGYIEEWRKLGLKFNAIQTGFLGSEAQIDYVFRFLDAFGQGALVCIDPVMGDYGRLYSTYSRELAESMRRFLPVADVLTPNLTEACVLADIPYDPQMPDSVLQTVARHLSAPHNAKVVITGIPRGTELVNYVYEDGVSTLVSTPKLGEDRSGTGDVFSSVILGALMNGQSFLNAVDTANLFVAHAVEASIRLDTPLKDGLAIEEVLGDLV